MSCPLDGEDYAAAQQKLGGVSEIKDVFVGFQKLLYAEVV
jgi:hypothetical protein